MTISRTYTQDFGHSISATISVRDLLNFCEVCKAVPDPDTGEVTGNQRPFAKVRGRKIAAALRERFQKFPEDACLFAQPIVLHANADHKIKSDEKLLTTVITSHPEIIDGQARTDGVRVLATSFYEDGDEDSYERLMNMRVKVEVYFNLPLYKQQQLFMMINYYVKPASKDVSYMFLQHIFYKDPGALTTEQQKEAVIARLGFELAGQANVFIDRVKTIYPDCKYGFSFVSLVNTLMDSVPLIKIKDVDGEVLLEMFSAGWQSCSKFWPALSDEELWPRLSHSNIATVGNHLIARLINRVNADDVEVPELTRAKAQAFFKQVMPLVLAHITKMAGGDPFVQVKFGGIADQFASGSTKGKLIDWADQVLSEI